MKIIDDYKGYTLECSENKHFYSDDTWIIITPTGLPYEITYDKAYGFWIDYNGQRIKGDRLITVFHRFVDKVSSVISKEQIGDIEKRGYERGWSSGREAGYAEGWNEGRDSNPEKSFWIGEGRQAGYGEGLKEGREVGKQEALNEIAKILSDRV